MADIPTLIAKNAERWKRAKITRAPEFASVAQRLVSGKARYLKIEKSTGVPWFVVAVIHEREASGRWNANIAQGDPWDQKSTHVPAGRGPFTSFEAAAYDALMNCSPKAGHWKDWTPGGTMTILEKYNGLAYANHDRPSPYVWSGTDIYDPPSGPGGKIMVDHGPIEPVVDKQLGCAGLILAMQQIDTSIKFGGVQQNVPTKEVSTGTVVVAGGAAAKQAHDSGVPEWIVVAIIVATVVAAFALYLYLNRKKGDT